MTSTPVARPDEVRRYNRTSLLRLLHVSGPRTRATLATELGLNRSTIKTLVDGLAEAGVVEERVPRPGRTAGRPSLLVLPQPQAAVVLAVDVQVEHVAMALVGLGGQILGRKARAVHAGVEVMLLRLVELDGLDTLGEAGGSRAPSDRGEMDHGCESRIEGVVRCSTNE